MPIFDLLPTAAAGLAVAWLVTYAIHSTLALGGLAAGLRLWRRRAEHPRLEERLWKVALVGSLATATLQVGVAAASPPAAQAGAAAPAAVAVAAAPAPVAAPGAAVAEAAAAGGALSFAELPAPAAAAAPPVAPAARPAAGPHPWLASARALLPGWQRLLLSTWMLGAALALGLFTLSWMRLRRALGRRRAIDRGAARDALDRLLARLGGRRRVRLTGSGRLPVPVALGVVAPEICVPEVALERLDRRQQAGMVAHELAHVLRRDPAWLLALRAAEVALFFQPLLGVARRRLEALSEVLADRWAVEQTGDRVALARCLTEVAGWLGERREGLPVPGMASGSGDLRQRVERILGGGPEPRAPRWPVAVGAALLLVALAVVPGLAPPSLADAAPAGEDVAGEAVAGTAPERAPGARFYGASEPGGAGEGWGGEHHHVFVHEHDWDWNHDFDFGESFGHVFDGDFGEGFDHVFDGDFFDGSWGESIAGMVAALLPGDHAHGLAGHHAGEEAEHAAHHVMEIEGVLAEALAEHHELWGELAEAHAELAIGAGVFDGELSAAIAESVGDLHESMAELVEGIAESHGELADALGELPPAERERLRAEADRLRARAEALADGYRPSPADLERLQAEARRLAERSRPSPEDLERLQAEARRLAERARPSEAELERLHAEARRLAERAEGQRVAPEEVDRLRAEARALAERSRPSPEELERLREEARALAERSRPSREELDRLRAEARRLAETARPSEAELERLRADARRLAREARRLAAEARDREAERRERTVEERERARERRESDEEPPR